MRKRTSYRYYLLSCNNHYYLYSLQEIEAAYPAQQLRQKKSTLEGTSKSVSGENNGFDASQVVAQKVQGMKAKKPLDGTLQRRYVPTHISMLRSAI